MYCPITYSYDFSEQWEEFENALESLGFTRISIDTWEKNNKRVKVFCDDTSYSIKVVFVDLSLQKKKTFEFPKTPSALGFFVFSELRKQKS